MLPFLDFAATFGCVHPATERLKRMLEEHFVVVHPRNGEIILQTQKQNLE